MASRACASASSDVNHSRNFANPSAVNERTLLSVPADERQEGVAGRTEFAIPSRLVTPQTFELFSFLCIKIPFLFIVLGFRLVRFGSIFYCGVSIHQLDSFLLTEPDEVRDPLCV